MSYSAEVLADSPVGYWRLGEASGTTAADSSGNGNDGTYQGTYTLAAAGIPGGGADKALSLAGAGAVLIGHPAGLELYGDLTLEAWLSSYAGGIWVLAKDTNTGARGYGIGVADGCGYLEVGGTSRVRGAGPNVTTGTHHLVATAAVSGGNRVWRLYVDGSEVGNATVAATTANAAASWYVGRRQYSGFEGYLSATLDEVAIYAATLSAARVAAHYNAGITAAPSALPWVYAAALRNCMGVN